MDLGTRPLSSGGYMIKIAIILAVFLGVAYLWYRRQENHRKNFKGLHK
jgi:preprotein translocase subunit YajC